MTEDRGRYQPDDTPAFDDEVESIGEILERLVDRQPWGQPPDTPPPPSHDGGSRRQQGR